MDLKKFYCYVDETGQDTKGELFLVTVIIEISTDLQTLQDKLFKIEKFSKKKHKWSKSSFKVRQIYLKQILTIKEVKNTIYYSIYNDTKSYIKLTALTIAKAISAKKLRNYTANILIDGLNQKSMYQIRNELKKLKISYTRIRGLKDEQDVILRLADNITGLLRDFVEKKEYANKIINKFKEAKIIEEV